MIKTKIKYAFVLGIGLLIGVGLCELPVTQDVAAYALAESTTSDQPHLQAALDHLRLAKSELQKANPDKGGHRTKAVSLTNDSIAETERAIEYARLHP
jgi:hypothetical protein